ncbi:MAG TPA: hypothetical protein VFS67_26170 [Polyangiaceae bacterium]|jgi:hypothetical protein|nr:hypothetical protein [Polyangiaceae bacterium]
MRGPIRFVLPPIAVVLIAWLLSGCVAPSVVVVDQKTALERQAAGEYPTLENDAEQAALSPAPEPFTREELAPGRERQGGGALGELAELYARHESDAEVIDRLLLQRCIGEATSGLLVARPADCIGAADATELVRVIGRENQHRRQLWQLLASERKADVDRTRRVWRELHLEQVVCGGLVESARERWEPKSC